VADFTDIGIVDLDPTTITWSQLRSMCAERRRLAELQARIGGAGALNNVLPGHAAPEVLNEMLLASPSTANADTEFDKKRNEWRARFRAALTTRAKEPDRGND
jgi:hypothetical protein